MNIDEAFGVLKKSAEEARNKGRPEPEIEACFVIAAVVIKDIGRIADSLETLAGNSEHILNRLMNR